MIVTALRIVAGTLFAIAAVIFCINAIAYNLRNQQLACELCAAGAAYSVIGLAFMRTMTHRKGHHR